jgi:hypothetical protein
MATATRWAGRWLRTQAVLQRKRATSLRIASLDPASVIDLDLSGSKDFVCTNLVGDGGCTVCSVVKCGVVWCGVVWCGVSVGAYSDQTQQCVGCSGCSMQSCNCEAR